MIEAVSAVPLLEAINEPIRLVDSLDFPDCLVVVVDNPKAVSRATHTLF
jgi:hypothetical protein